MNSSEPRTDADLGVLVTDMRKLSELEYGDSFSSSTLGRAETDLLLAIRKESACVKFGEVADARDEDDPERRLREEQVAESGDVSELTELPED